MVESASGEPQHWLAETKFSPPLLREDVVPRQRLLDDLRSRLDGLVGQTIQGHRVSDADDYAYHDPVDGSVSAQQGIRVLFDGGARFVIRLSGTGTSGATIRLYLESLETDPANFDQDPQDALRWIILAAEDIAGIRARTGKSGPDVTT